MKKLNESVASVCHIFFGVGVMGLVRGREQLQVFPIRYNVIRSMHYRHVQASVLYVLPSHTLFGEGGLYT